MWTTTEFRWDESVHDYVPQGEFKVEYGEILLRPSRSPQHARGAQWTWEPAHFTFELRRPPDVYRVLTDKEASETVPPPAQ